VARETATAARLIIDVGAVVANYNRLKTEVARSSAEVSAVVKADCYGLGASAIVPHLRNAGCPAFFVARIDEGSVVRSLAPGADIYVLDGVAPGSEPELTASDLIPVINSLGQLERWRDEARRRQHRLRAGLHIDTGMLRLGLSGPEFQMLAEKPERLDGLDVRLVMSHLASAEEAASDQSEQQLEEFCSVRRRLTIGLASLANSSGIFRGPAYHFDLVRPGYALYGGNPWPAGESNPMSPVVSLEAPILETRWAEPGKTTGYGATYRFEARSRLATIGIGYADGFLRSASNRGTVLVAGQPAPIVGRVSMDLVTIDVTGIREDALAEGSYVEVIGPGRTVDDVAADAGTIGYEVLTALSNRYHRSYREPPSVTSPQVVT